METVGRKTFSEATDGLPFSAHPRQDADGTVWNFGYVTQLGALVFWKIDPSGKLQRVGTVPCKPMSMPHDFIVTRKHLVVLIPPLHFNAARDTHVFLDAHEWHADEATRVLAVDKDNFDVHRWYELPAQWVFHFGNGWEDNEGIIRFDGARLPDPSIMSEDFRAIMSGATPAAQFAQHYSYRIDTRRKRATESLMFDPHLGSEFPAIEPRVSGLNYQRIVLLTADRDKPPTHGYFHAVSVANTRQERLDSFTYPDHVLPEEHLYVPAPGSLPEESGWVVGTALDYRSGHSELNVFNVNAIADGPIASARLPYALPLGLHGKFVQQVA